ncbi:MAG: MCE family protein, partial [Sulfurovum sp.]|nr:MCE family protein [Sulfurovaceae bacterium]
VKESVTGLSKDSGIKMKGVDIGIIKSISINPKNIEEIDIILKIKKSIPIKEDMFGIINMYGLTGLSYIDISGGTNSSALLISNGDSLPIIKSGISLLSKLSNNLDEVMIKFVLLLDSTHKILSNNNIENFNQSLENVKKLSDKTLILESQAIKRLEEGKSTLIIAKKSIKEFTEDFHKVSSSINLATKEIHKEIIPSIHSFTKMSRSLDKMVIIFEKSIMRGDYNMQKIVEPIVIDLRELSIQIEQMATDFEESPSDILFKSNRPRKGPGE